jgi:hypothetical protein
VIRRLAASVAALVVIVGASACAGPRTPVAVGIKEFPTDVLLGMGEDNLTPLEKSPIETNPVVVPPRRPRTNVPLGTPAPTPKVHCPEADPLSAPKQEATNRTIVPPVETSYTFRTKGSVDIDGKSSQLAPQAVRTIQNVERLDESTFTFEVLDELGTEKTLQRYRVVQRGSLDEAVKGETGIFITETVRGDGTDEPTTYTWEPPITLLRFPIEHGDTWDVHSTALDGQVVQRFSARIGDTDPDSEEDPDPLPQPGESKVRVDACGEYIDAWNVNIGVSDATGEPSGRYVGPETLFTFADTYAIASQYGGVVVMEHRTAEGDSAGAAIKSDRTSTINLVPELPKS